MVRGLFFCPVVALVLGTAVPAQGQTTEICATHRVAAGDHLFALAKTYYQNADQAFALYSANRTLIGPDPNTLTVGQELQIPCSLDGVSLDQATLQALPRLPSPAKTIKAEIEPEVRDAASAADPAPVVAQSVAELKPMGASMLAGTQPADAPPSPVDNPAPTQGPLSFRLLTGGPYAPFAGKDLPQGGLITDILAHALSGLDDAPTYDIAFVNDRDAHLPLLLKRGGFDLGFPWIFPDCQAPILSETESTMCENYVASEPLYEHVTEFYVRADNARAEAVSPMDLAGGVLCRPDGYPLDDLFRSGLLPDEMTIQRAPDSQTCLELLDAGEVDVASMEA
ncbi:MAG: hypothetical protein AAGA78_10050, partial [Pseudomonadota bacterium]